MTNGLVVMIAAVSPASICYPETVSTLRFADRVKTVKVKVCAECLVAFCSHFLQWLTMFGTELFH